MKKTRFVPLLVLLALLASIPLLAPTPASAQDEHQCYQCYQFGLSQFCFFGYPGRSNCVNTQTYCAMSGAFCDQITIIG